MHMGAFAQRWVGLFHGLKKRTYVIIGALVIFVTNIASLISSIEKIQEYIYSVFGLYDSLILYSWFKFTLIASILIGYALIALYGYIVFFKDKKRKHQLLYGALAIVVGAVVCAVNLEFIRERPPAATPLLQQAASTLSKAILSQQESSGGFRFWQGPSTETQVWTTAQCLYAILLANKLPRGPQVATTEEIAERSQAIKAAFNYIDRVRLPAAGGGRMGLYGQPRLECD